MLKTFLQGSSLGHRSTFFTSFLQRLFVLLAAQWKINNIYSTLRQTHIYIRWALLDVFVSILSTIPTYDCAPGGILLSPEFVVSCDAHAGHQISTSFRLITFSQPSGKPQEEQFSLFSLVITEVIVSGWQPCCRFDKRHRQQCNETWRESRNVWHKCLELKQYQSQSASHVCPCFSLCGDLCVCYTAATSPRDKSQDG